MSNYHSLDKKKNVKSGFLKDDCQNVWVIRVDSRSHINAAYECKK